MSWWVAAWSIADCDKRRHWVCDLRADGSLVSRGPSSCRQFSPNAQTTGLWSLMNAQNRMSSSWILTRKKSSWHEAMWGWCWHQFAVVPQCLTGRGSSGTSMHDERDQWTSCKHQCRIKTKRNRSPEIKYVALEHMANTMSHRTRSIVIECMRWTRWPDHTSDTVESRETFENFSPKQKIIGLQKSSMLH